LIYQYVLTINSQIDTKIIERNFTDLYLWWSKSD
jgi:hypothetical protein